jgi:type I restriction enzyme S subunit
LAISEVPVSINQGFIAILCDKEVSNYYILNWVKFNLGIIKNMAGGSTFQEINKANFRIIKILVPSQDLMRDYNTLLNKMHEGIALNEKQSRKLVEIIDAILPKLMSGKIRVLNNQKIKEAV